MVEMDTRRMLRSLGAGGTLDDRQLIELVEDPSLRPHLQEAGESLLAITQRGVTDCLDAAKLLATQLTERCWVGDEELANLLLSEAASTVSDRRQIRADLDGVAELLEGPLEMGYGGILDCQTGYAWPEAVLDDWAGAGDAPDPDVDPDRYLFIPNEGSREAWEDMRSFTEDVADAGVRTQLLKAIDGRGAFSRFRHVLDQAEDLRAAWYARSAETRAGRARQWLANEGYDALPPQL
jgi:hypothetical protein